MEVKLLVADFEAKAIPEKGFDENFANMHLIAVDFVKVFFGRIDLFSNTVVILNWGQTVYLLRIDRSSMILIPRSSLGQRKEAFESFGRDLLYCVRLQHQLDKIKNGGNKLLKKTVFREQMEISTSKQNLC